MEEYKYSEYYVNNLQERYNNLLSDRDDEI